MCGEKGRWKQNLIAKCMRDGAPHDDEQVSPVVRQTLLHWAYELTEADFKQGAKWRSWDEIVPPFTYLPRALARAVATQVGT